MANKLTIQIILIMIIVASCRFFFLSFSGRASKLSLLLYALPFLLAILTVLNGTRCA